MRKALNGRRVIVFAEQLYEDLELWYPVLRMKEEGAAVTIAGTKGKEYTGKHGYPVIADTSVNELSASEIDAVIVPGGYAPDFMRRDPDMLRFVRAAVEQKKIVAAICHAGWVLASAGVLKGRKATCYFSIKDDIVNAGAEYRDAEVVRDGNLITSRQPSDLGAFCREIVTALAEEGR